ncbi:MAG TPA: DUF4194 domain-containing protein [Candidatus Cryptobacteroides sp.]|nr:DUF4194 domain-containing protein [Candidatus Cryptobacteroides sp.]
MIHDARDLAALTDLTDGERDVFSRATQTLLAHSFIVRGAEKDDSLWNFSIRNIRLLELWFSFAGITIKRDETLGVIAIRPLPVMRIRLTKEATVALLVLRLLFEEKRRELSLARFPSVNVFDFVQRFSAVTNQELKKTRLVEVLRFFSRWRLISIEGEFANPDSIMILYPSISMSLDQEGVEEILGALENEGRNPEQEDQDDDLLFSDDAGEEEELEEDD